MPDIFRDDEEIDRVLTGAGAALLAAYAEVRKALVGTTAVRLYRYGPATVAEFDFGVAVVAEGEAVSVYPSLPAVLASGTGPRTLVVVGGRPGSFARRVLVSKAAGVVVSDRDLRIMYWMSMGLSNKEIGAKLGIRTGTVRNRLSELFKRCGVQSRSELMRVMQDTDLMARVNDAMLT